MHSLPCLIGHQWTRIALHCHGPANSTHPPLICAHGLTRNAHDFDYLAQRLGTERRVIAFDFPGRGHSDWLHDKSAYHYGHYLTVATAVIAWSGATQVDWLGTSMGGLLGMMIAAAGGYSPIRRLILNDVAPEVPAPAMQRIVDYMRQPPRPCTSLHELADYLAEVHAPFAPMQAADWQHMAATGHRRLADGRYLPAYDPDIAVPLQAAALAGQRLDLWAAFAAIDCPLMLMHGARSDVLTDALVARMRQQQPDCLYYCDTRAGHVPSLRCDEHCQHIAEFLETP